jgi:protein-S-isoprenylcysteine O-methyltransferase Ste14
MQTNKLAIKSILGMLNLVVMMGVALFLPAYTLHYLQAWIYMGVFFGGVSIITVYIFVYDKQLLQSRLKVGSMAEPRKAQKVIQAIASLGFIGMYIISGFDYRFQWSEVPQWLWLASDAMLLVAMMMLFLIFRKNSYLSATIEVQRGQHVVTDGPYGVVRHPMYSMAMLLFVFGPLALGSYCALTILPVMLLVMMLRCLDEEKVLSSELQGYEAYCRKVHYRMIPFVW